MRMEEESFPVVLFLFSLAPTVCFMIMWPTGDDDMYWGAIMALPFWAMATVHHVFTRPHKRQRLSTCVQVATASVGVWLMFFLIAGDPWHWEQGTFVVSSFCSLAPAFYGAFVAPERAIEEHRMAKISGSIMALPLCFMAIFPAFLVL